MTEVDWMEVLDSDFAGKILSYCDTKFCHLSFSPVAKRCNAQFVKHLLLHSSEDVQKASFCQPYGPMLQIIFDNLKMATVVTGSVGLSEEATNVLQSSNDIKSLQSEQYYTDYYILAGAVYTNWDCTPYDANRGTFHEFREMMYEQDHSKEIWSAIEEDVQYWSSSRVFDHFLVLFDREDGTIVVSSDLKRVYLVVGSDKEKTLGAEANLSVDLKKKVLYPNPPYKSPRLYGPILGTRMALTLVNWKGKITYDGITRGIDKGTDAHIRIALRVYKKALQNNSIIYNLQKVTPTPCNIIRANPNVPKEVVEEYYETLANEFNLIAKFLHRSNPRKDLPWIFVNEGWSEEKQTYTMRIHVTATEAIPGIPIGQHNASVKDIIQAIFEVTFSAHHVPWGIVIDDPEHLYTLFELLNPFRLSVSYKPPISAENKSVEEDNSRKRCVVCLCTTCPNGRSLLRCSKCQKVFYCSVDHQTQHWKAHKIHCT